MSWSSESSKYSSWWKMCYSAQQFAKFSMDLIHFAAYQVEKKKSSVPDDGCSLWHAHQTIACLIIAKKKFLFWAYGPPIYQDRKSFFSCVNLQQCKRKGFGTSENKKSYPLEIHLSNLQFSDSQVPFCKKITKNNHDGQISHLIRSRWNLLPSTLLRWTLELLGIIILALFILMVICGLSLKV